MKAWPFSEDDWESVQETVFDLVNISNEEDGELIAVKIKDVLDLLEALAIKYGPHPVLFETKADIMTNAVERVELYRQAINLAEQESLPTTTVRLSLAEVLIEDLGDNDAAKKELELCKEELTEEDDLEEWKSLTERANQSTVQ
jgi:hypothetical protein